MAIWLDMTCYHCKFCHVPSMPLLNRQKYLQLKECTKRSVHNGKLLLFGYVLTKHKEKKRFSCENFIHVIIIIIKLGWGEVNVRGAFPCNARLVWMIARVLLFGSKGVLSVYFSTVQPILKSYFPHLE